MENYFSDLEHIYENRHQYSIEWAYKEAQEKLDTIRNHISEESKDQIQSKHMRCKHVLRINKWFSSIFQNTFTVITVLEFVLSILLVLIVSEFSHQGEAFVASRFFSFSVVLVFAFIKVFIEQYFLRPTIERIGWRLYQKTVESLKSLTHQFNL